MRAMGERGANWWDRRVAQVVASVVLLAAGIGLSASPAAMGKAPTGVVASLPGSYIVNYGHRAKACRGLITPPWVSWLSYASAKVSDEWRVYASSTALCSLARNTADAVIFDAQYDDGAGQVLSRMLSFGLHHHSASRTAAPRPAGGSWKCDVLPSFWGQQAYDLARLAHRPGGPLPGDFAAASGPAAGAGFCDTKTKASNGRVSGGSFFSWAPNTGTCKRSYKLKEIPDPNNPGETKNPPFPSALWGDYDLVSC